jgi:hypothetical protein
MDKLEAIFQSELNDVTQTRYRDKINELVDAVNKLYEYNNLLFERIGEVNTRVAQLENHKHNYINTEGGVTCNDKTSAPVFDKEYEKYPVNVLGYTLEICCPDMDEALREKEVEAHVFRECGIIVQNDKNICIGKCPWCGKDIKRVKPKPDIHKAVKEAYDLAMFQIDKWGANPKYSDEDRFTEIAEKLKPFVGGE